MLHKSQIRANRQAIRAVKAQEPLPRAQPVIVAARQCADEAEAVRALIGGARSAGAAQPRCAEAYIRGLGRAPRLADLPAAIEAANAAVEAEIDRGEHGPVCPVGLPPYGDGLAVDLAAEVASWRGVGRSSLCILRDANGWRIEVIVAERHARSVVDPASEWGGRIAEFRARWDDAPAPVSA